MSHIFTFPPVCCLVFTGHLPLDIPMCHIQSLIELHPEHNLLLQAAPAIIFLLITVLFVSRGSLSTLIGGLCRRHIAKYCHCLSLCISKLYIFILPSIALSTLHILYMYASVFDPCMFDYNSEWQFGCVEIKLVFESQHLSLACYRMIHLHVWQCAARSENACRYSIVPSIHLRSIRYAAHHFILVDLEPIPGAVDVRQEYAQHRTPFHHKAICIYTLTHSCLGAIFTANPLVFRSWKERLQTPGGLCADANLGSEPNRGPRSCEAAMLQGVAMCQSTHRVQI